MIRYIPQTNFIHLLFIIPSPQAEQKSYYEHPKKIVRSLRLNRAVVFFALTCQCEDIVRSLSEKTKYKGKHLCWPIKKSSVKPWLYETYILFAERQGFEPRVPRSTTVFKTAAIDHSATSPKLFLRVSCFSKAMQRYALFWNLQIFGNIFLIFLFNPFLEPGNRPSLLRRQKPDL